MMAVSFPHTASHCEGGQEANCWRLTYEAGNLVKERSTVNSGLGKTVILNQDKKSSKINEMLNQLSG